MMKKTTLEGLKGLVVSEAKKVAEGEGLTCNLLPKGSMRIMLAVANTVFLYHEGGVVCDVSLGDPSELE
jgi:hypothetical protein